ncbi:MAG TPA: hypothetical protein VE422_31615 [Terriglobia bacterium]|nr:hypothetical protein [Terriglobia bacterium]
MNRRFLAVIAVIAMPLLFSLAALAAQRGAGGQRGAPPAPRAAAPFDITGYWTALITEDWEYRMVTPAKGSIEFVPLNNAARTAAGAWDPAKDEQAGLQCKGYGAAGVMRLPTRLHITWENDTTLKVETDYGTQTRTFHFSPQTPPAEKTWQGVSIAQWETGASGRGGRGGALPEGVAAPPSASKEPVGALKVVTTNMRAGYLRKNGVPYSETAVLTEWFNIIQDQNFQYLAVQTQVDDPAFLTGPFFRTLQFKKEPNGNKWSPTPCSAR